MAATLAALDERGLIQRRADPDDGRRQLISPSDAGREFIDDSRQTWPCARRCGSWTSRGWACSPVRSCACCCS
jgi:DNA-binding MarR family transcriptional regulator